MSGTLEIRPFRNLSYRETEVLHLIAVEYLTNQQIAERLALAVPTVDRHVHHILQKLHTPTRQQAARLYMAKAAPPTG